jgi:hypothetical protein
MNRVELAATVGDSLAIVSSKAAFFVTKTRATKRNCAAIEKNASSHAAGRA